MGRFFNEMIMGMKYFPVSKTMEKMRQDYTIAQGAESPPALTTEPLTPYQKKVLNLEKARAARNKK